jgi:hypothetical protein
MLLLEILILHLLVTDHFLVFYRIVSEFLCE